MRIGKGLQGHGGGTAVGQAVKATQLDMPLLCLLLAATSWIAQVVFLVLGVRLPHTRHVVDELCTVTLALKTRLCGILQAIVLSCLYMCA